MSHAEKRVPRCLRCAATQFGVETSHPEVRRPWLLHSWMGAIVVRRPESTGGKQVNGRELTQFKPGQSGNPKGRPKGSRNKLSEAFIADLAQSWQTYGRAALQTVAESEPSVFVRIVASLMPREMDTTATNVELDRMGDQELNALFAQCVQDGLAERP